MIGLTARLQPDGPMPCFGHKDEKNCNDDSHYDNEDDDAGNGIWLSDYDDKF